MTYSLANKGMHQNLVVLHKISELWSFFFIWKKEKLFIFILIELIFFQSMSRKFWHQFDKTLIFRFG